MAKFGILLTRDLSPGPSRAPDRSLVPVFHMRSGIVESNAVGLIADSVSDVLLGE